MSTNSELVRDHLDEVLEAGSTLLQVALDERGLTEVSAKFVRVQGPQSTYGGAPGRSFSVSGPKADRVRALIFADQGLTRKELAQLAECSVSRVAEVVWGLEHDELEFPTIPLRPMKVDESTSTPAAPNMPRE